MTSTPHSTQHSTQHSSLTSTGFEPLLAPRAQDCPLRRETVRRQVASVRTRPETPVLALVLAGSALLVVGCKAKVLRPSEADAFRAREATLRADLDRAQRRVSELETKLAAVEARSTTHPTLDAEAAAALPALARVEVSSLSSARRTGERAARLDLVVAPEDALGRFIQLTGTLRVQAVVLAPGDAAPARPPVAVSRTVGPAELRAAYRAGLLGTHYTVEVDIAWDETFAGEPRAISVAAEFVDALSGRVFPAVGTVAILPERRRPASAEGGKSSDAQTRPSGESSAASR